MKTFVYHDGALGDTLLSLPCLERLRPGSDQLYLVGRGDVARFLKDTGVVDGASSSHEALFASLYSSIDPRLRAFLSGFDRAFVFSIEEHSAAAATIRTVIPRTLAIRTIPPDGSKLHAARYRLSQLVPDGPASGGHRPLRMQPERVREAHSLLHEAGYRVGADLVALHPGSGGRAKCWPLERYFDLIERLQSRDGVFVVLFTGEAEEGGCCQAVASYARGKRDLLHAAGLGLSAAASLLTLCRQYVGNDSGLSHLAGILGCATIVLFGPTDPLVWKPLGPCVETVSPGVPGPMTLITVDEAIAKIGVAAPYFRNATFS